MNLSISNIAWSKAQDEAVYGLMHKYGYNGLEIAPSRIIDKKPYDNLQEATEWAKELKKNHGFTISSMQSIWYGRQENLWESLGDQNFLIQYTQKAIHFAEAVKCEHLVFGCPRNRNMPNGASIHTAIDFFRAIGEYAAKHNVAIGIEANPAIYNTNFLNDTKSAISFVREVASEGITFNLDIGTMIENNEIIDILEGNTALIHHVHISEPNLITIKNHEVHKKLNELLKKHNYSHFISMEMKQGNSLLNLENAMAYVASIFS